MISVILAGGKGLRLWPESRRTRPKQLCKLVGNRSMLDHTIDRLIKAGSRHIVIITNDDLLPTVNELVIKRNDHHLIEVLSEPEGKNTAPAVGLVLSRYQDNSEDLLGIFPADHHVLDIKAFKESISRAILAAKRNYIVTIGITPSRPETGYGYIEKTRWEIGDMESVYPVQSFCEKPNLSIAQSYLATGQHMWNAGIYIGKASTFLQEFKTHLPEIYKKLTRGYEQYIQSYPELPEISLDYGIAEKSSCMAVVPSDFGWCDLGSWNALADLYKEDPNSNICSGTDVLLFNSQNCVVKQAEKTVVLFDVQDLLVVETDDIILVSDRKKSQDVRNIVDTLSREQRYDLL